MFTGIVTDIGEITSLTPVAQGQLHRLRVASSFVAANLVDEFWLLRGADAVGADGIAALDALPLAAITQSPAFRVRASESLGSDTLTVYERC